ncbi:hypothetical protein FFLO_06771 [Filobasidium floriforme]|uniref:Uncharacterized protein n=1 Tax=Filobasidium floriforme TaxID=5210 RepID=A0A8K0JER3_9TREE|nr:hypothetical protein FFLO_06771 [Filobasidium floriforme]
MYYFTSFKQHGLSSQQDKISTSSTPSLLPSYTRVPKKQRVIPFLSYEGSDPLTRYILVTLTFPAEKPEREDKAGEVACENARRLEDMVNDQSMETEDVQNGASGSVAFKPVEVDELTELDKAGIDNSTDKAGVDNSTESKELGADNLMELDKVEMTKSMQLESVGADNLMDLDKVEEVVESIESEGTGAGNLMEPENMEDDKVTAEFDNQDHHNARLSSTTNNRSNRNSPWYRKRNGKNGQKKETDVQVRDPLTEPAGLAGPGLSTSEVRVSVRVCPSLSLCNGTWNHSGSTEAYLETCQDIRRDIITYIWKDGDMIGKTEIYLERWRYIWRDGDTSGEMEIHMEEWSYSRMIFWMIGRMDSPINTLPFSCDLYICHRMAFP